MRGLIEERLLEAHSFRDFCPWLAGSIDVDPKLGRASRWRAWGSRAIPLMVARMSLQNRKELGP